MVPQIRRLILHIRVNGDKIIYVRQLNHGPGSARNTGIRRCSGKYLQFLDSDDLLDKDKISLQIDQLRTTSQLALSYCDYVNCSLADIKKTYNRHDPFLNPEDPLHDIATKWETQLSIPIHSFLFDAALFKEKEIYFDENLPANEDWQCWMDIFALKPKVFFLAAALAYYRIKDLSRCRDRRKMRKAWITSINNQIDRFRFNETMVQKLVFRKKELRYLYRDASPTNQLIDKGPPIFRKLFEKVLPWRIQRIFD